MTQTKVYLLLAGLTVLGYIYIFLASEYVSSEIFPRCIFQNVTGFPCPSCGSTRAMLELVHGHYLRAFTMNCLCYVQALFLLFSPLLLIFDLIFNTRWVYRIYIWIISQINRRCVAITLISLIAVNWVYLIVENR
ncbi:MAG: DUF2752 domain-containing protein [Bacteroidales bacterium]